MHPVYRQATPIATGQMFWEGGKQVPEHRANLVLVGTAKNFEEAKKLCPYPVMDVNEVRVQ